eukprot:GILK01004486.1.p1 GENE.GILK01004486.1~~GILK01004486.1.p1  ORF type:complete len:812 (-),score=171.25 GILK01004486.1:123-2225(-)
MTDIEQDLSRLMKESIQQHHDLLSQQVALAAAAALISHCDLLADETNFGQFQLVVHNLTQFMRLDAAAVKALSLLPSSGDRNRSSSSLYGLLNKCKTVIGSRLLLRWLKQPLLDKTTIEQRLDVVQLFADDILLRQNVQMNHLRKVPDLEKLTTKFHKVSSKTKHNAGLQDCVKMYDFVNNLKPLVTELGSYNGQFAEVLEAKFGTPLQDVLRDFETLTSMIEQAVDLPRAAKHQYLINPQFSPEFAELAADKEDIEEEMQRLKDKVESELGCTKPKKGGDVVKLEEHNTHGYVFRVSKKEGDKAFRELSSAGRATYRQITVRKDGIVFNCKELQDLCSRYGRCNREYQEKQQELVDRALEIVATYHPVIDRATQLLAELDVLVSFAHVSVNSPVPYVRPSIHPIGQGSLVLTGSRHPCLEAMDDRNFIANDVEMIRGESSLHIITGPNMGGKSTYIRQVGICVLLSQVGCFVPCAAAEVPLFDCIMARIGASDHQLRGVSTFMAEMLEAACILKTASKNSLVIVDELGRGTSTFDGFGIAWAMAEFIVKELGSFCLFATHFHELTELALRLKSVVNCLVTAMTTKGTLTFLYKVERGCADRSYGLHVAEMAQLPEDVLENAKRKAEELENFEANQSIGDGSSHIRKRIKLEKANEATESFLNRFSLIPLPTSDPKELPTLLQTLKTNSETNDMAVEPLQ